jgi:SAM-dependent methyltransferase
MNRLHRWLCRSTPWKATLESRILPWVLDGIDLGSNVLELGPGPGLTTDVLRARVDRLTCVEIDSELAAEVSRRTANGNVRVLCEDATAMSLPDSTLDGAISVMMLHHVPLAALQNRLLAEVARVLRPGATFAGADSVASRWLRLIHIGDVLLPIDPATFAARLEAAGFVNVQVDEGVNAFRFRAQRADM